MVGEVFEDFAVHAGVGVYFVYLGINVYHGNFGDNLVRVPWNKHRVPRKTGNYIALVYTRLFATG